MCHLNFSRVERVIYNNIVPYGLIRTDGNVTTSILYNSNTLHSSYQSTLRSFRCACTYTQKRCVDLELDPFLRTNCQKCLCKSLKCFFGDSFDGGGVSIILIRTKWIFRTNLPASRLVSQCVIKSTIPSFRNSVLWVCCKPSPSPLLSGIYYFNC